jgi:hypothetical protein
MTPYDADPREPVTAWHESTDTRAHAARLAAESAAWQAYQSDDDVAADEPQMEASVA